MWNYNIEQAPKGWAATAIISVDGKPRKRDVFNHEKVITASECGKVIVSKWLPDQQRWEGYKKDEQPIAWQDYPRHPSAE